MTFLGKQEFQISLASAHEFFQKKANDSFVKQQKRLITFPTADAKASYDLLQHDYPGIYQRVSKKILAAYLGLSRETLSRLSWNGKYDLLRIAYFRCDGSSLEVLTLCWPATDLQMSKPTRNYGQIGIENSVCSIYIFGSMLIA
jgi:hypothetical protein